MCIVLGFDESTTIHIIYDFSCPQAYAFTRASYMKLARLSTEDVTNATATAPATSASREL